MANCYFKNLCSGFFKLRIDITRSSTTYSPPRYRPPYWYTKKNRVLTDEKLTAENKDFLQEVLQDKYGAQPSQQSPIANVDFQPTAPWDSNTRRVGLIAKKIGNYPMWLKNGKKVQTTLLQVVDNHVIKYIPPENFKPLLTKSKISVNGQNRFGCILVGSESVDPATVTKEYHGIFNSVGMMPKKHLCRFTVSPHAALPTGTPLLATHFRAGDFIDVRAKTIDRGFQGVMKRWGFKGQPASHGQTKTHRRPGNIGAGGNKARVWPGTKMPGHMGNRWRTLRGVKILRINTKHNVLWALGVGVPGETGALCYLYDTVLPLRRPEDAPPFPTQPPRPDQPLELCDESVHLFEEPTIAFEQS